MHRVRYSNHDSSYPSVSDLDAGTTWPDWKRDLSDETVLYRLGFHRVDDYDYKRVQNGLALYISTPKSAFGRLKLWACYVDHRIRSSRMEIKAGRSAGIPHGELPPVIHYLLRGCDNSLIVSEMDTSN